MQSNRIRWRRSRRTVRREALKLIRNNGELAFLRAHEFAWAAQGNEDRRQARFWQAVGGEISRQIQRNSILAAILTPASLQAAGPAIRPATGSDDDEERSVATAREARPLSAKIIPLRSPHPAVGSRRMQPAATRDSRAVEPASAELTPARPPARPGG